MNPTTDTALSAGYVAIEGIDGAGSTTQRDLIVERLRGLGVATLATAQPSKGSIGAMIRRVLRREEEPLDPVAMQLAFTADRIDYATKVLRPALDAGNVVVSDRCEMSTAVYLAARQPLSDTGWLSMAALTDVKVALGWNASTLHPGLIILIDVPAEIAAARRRARGGNVETFDTNDFQARAQRLYIHATGIMHTAKVVDGIGTQEEVQARVWEHVAPFVETWLEARGLEAIR